METINDNNYELWLLRYAEDELSVAERATVEQWLEGHPEAAEELALYSEAPHLECDESVRYTAPVVQPSRPLWAAGWRWAAAAAVALLLLTPLALWLTSGTGHDAPQVAQTVPQKVVPAQADSITPEHPVATPARSLSDRVLGGEPVETQRPFEPVESLLLMLPEQLEAPLVAEAVESAVEEPAVEEPEAGEPALIYVDNLFTVDSGDAIQQRLMAVNETLKGRLQGTYLGRRLARRMPTGDELLEYTDNLRERTPQGVRMMADMVLAYNDSNK